MPKLRRALSIFLVIWLCVMLVTFTYTWVSRNWTPSIEGENINIASSGALLISLMSDTEKVHTEVTLNDVVNLKEFQSFTFRQVSSQDGSTFFYKDFTPTIDQQAPAIFRKITTGDTHSADYIDTRFCLKLDSTVEEEKYVFIHPDTMIDPSENVDYPVDKAIRISLTYEKITETESGVIREMNTVILGDLDDNTGVVNPNQDLTTDKYLAVKPDANGKDDAEGTDALGFQTVYGLHYFDCGRGDNYDPSVPLDDKNYKFDRDENKALFKIAPGDTVWITMRIWMEGQDEHCVEDIAGEFFDMILKFDSAFVTKPTE